MITVKVKKLGDIFSTTYYEIESLNAPGNCRIHAYTHSSFFTIFCWRALTCFPPFLFSFFRLLLCYFLKKILKITALQKVFINGSRLNRQNEKNSLTFFPLRILELARKLIYPFSILYHFFVDVLLKLLFTLPFFVFFHRY